MGKMIEVHEDVLRAAIEAEVILSFGLGYPLIEEEAADLATSVVRRVRQLPTTHGTE